MPKIPLAVQMYTLRDDTARDFPGTLRAVADIGYSAVELAGHGSLSTPELKALLDELHLSVAGSHISLEALETDLTKVVSDAHILGNKHIVVPYLSEDRRKDAAGYKQTAETLESFGGRADVIGPCPGATTTTILSSSNWITASSAWIFSCKIRARLPSKPK